ncbi:ATP-binding protein [Streptomyces sp. SS]|uniref:ATP-binding protein n=1 Tax=Streptomyces sp. SS TaxID=260742 RepID=UPI0002D4D106|nr:ATP-binding protein [Streptomyces sp. SS]
MKTAQRTGVLERDGESTADETVVSAGLLTYSCLVPHIPQAVGLVRRHVHSRLTGWGVTGEAADEVLLVVSELVTNSVLYARPPVELDLTVSRTEDSRRIRVAVRDRGPVPGDGTWQPSADEHGRGCAIVAALAAGCGDYEDHQGFVRWADLECSGPL